MRASAAAVESDDQLLLFGGEGSLRTASVYALPLRKPGKWQRWTCQGRQPPALSCLTATRLGQHVLIFGGEFTADDPTNPTRKRKPHDGLYSLDLASKTWSRIIARGQAPTYAQPSPRKLHTATALDEHRLLVYGGCGHSALAHSREEYYDEAFIFNKQNSTWTQLTITGHVPGRRAGHTAALHPDHRTLVIYGGITDPLHQTALYVPLGSILTLTSQSPVAPVHVGADRIVKAARAVFMPAVVTVMDTQTGVCGMLDCVGSHPGPLSQHTSCCDPGGRQLLYIIGGKRRDGSHNGSVYLLDMENASWSSLHAIPLPRRWCWNEQGSVDPDPFDDNKDAERAAYARAALPSARSAHVMVAKQGMGMIVFGGTGASGYSDANVYTLTGMPTLPARQLRRGVPPVVAIPDEMLAHTHASHATRKTLEVASPLARSPSKSYAKPSPTSGPSIPTSTDRRDLWLYRSQLGGDEHARWRASAVPTTAAKAAASSPTPGSTYGQPPAQIRAMTVQSLRPSITLSSVREDPTAGFTQPKRMIHKLRTKLRTAIAMGMCSPIQPQGGGVRVDGPPLHPDRAETPLFEYPGRGQTPMTGTRPRRHRTPDGRPAGASPTLHRAGMSALHGRRVPPPSSLVESGSSASAAHPRPHPKFEALLASLNQSIQASQHGIRHSPGTVSLPQARVSLHSDLPAFHAGHTL